MDMPVRIASIANSVQVVVYSLSPLAFSREQAAVPLRDRQGAPPSTHFSLCGIVRMSIRVGQDPVHATTAIGRVATFWRREIGKLAHAAQCIGGATSAAMMSEGA